MSLPNTYTWAAPDTAYICALQTRSGSGALLINGTGADATSAMLNSPRVWLRGTGFERTVSLTSTGSLSGVNFTIVGESIRGDAVTEIIAGPSNNTVYTTAFFYKITSVSVSATVGTSVSLGTGTTGQSQWYRPDYNLTPVSVALQVAVLSGTITWSLKQTLTQVLGSEPPATAIFVSTDTNMVSQTVSRQGSYTTPMNACRFTIDSSTTGALNVRIFQAGIV